jgi:hypothetical protein
MKPLFLLDNGVDQSMFGAQKMRKWSYSYTPALSGLLAIEI